MTITAGDLNNTAQKYRKQLLMAPIIALENTLKHMTLVPGIQWKEIVGELTGDFELRPYTGDINEQSAGAIATRELEVFVGDLIFYEEPEKLRKSILGASLLGDNKPVSKFPLTAQMIAFAIRRVHKKLNTHIWDAVRNATGTTTADLFNGFDTITALDIASGAVATAKKNYFDIGAITTANVVDQLRDFYQGVSDELQEQMTKMFISRSIYNMYNQTYKDENGSLPYNNEYKKTFLEGSDNMCELVPLVGKKSSNYIHLTTRANTKVGVDQMSDAEVIKVREVENPWKLQFAMKALFGVQFDSVISENFAVAYIGTGSGS